MSADREALVDAFLGSLRALLLAGTAEGCAPAAPVRNGRTLKVKEVAERYEVAVKTVYGWVDSGMLPALRLPGRNGAGSYRFRDADLTEFDRRRECNWTPPAPVVLTPAGETGPARASRSNAFQRGARLGAVPLPARAAAVLVAAGAA
jgi:excisionase family DNA binding protein